MVVHIRYKHTACDFSIRFDGHADYNPGNDVVCSSVSTIASMLMMAFYEAEEKQEVKKLIVEFGSGYTYISGYYSKMNCSARHIFNAAIKTLQEISKQYPKNVRIVKGE